MAKQLLSCDKVIAKAIKLEVSDHERLVRQLTREDEPWIDEIFRRYKEDKKDYDNLDFPYQSFCNESKHNLNKTVDSIRNNFLTFFLNNEKKKV